MGAEIGGALGALVCQAVIGSLVGAVILRAACSWYNSMVGRSSGRKGYANPPPAPGQLPTHGNNPYASPTTYSHMPDRTDVGVPEPDFGKAWLISFVTILINGMIGFVVGLAIGLGGAAAGAQGAVPVIISMVVSIPISFLVFAGMLTAMLPTSFGRAAIVTLLYFVISLLVGLAIAAVVFAVIFLTGMIR
jgi:hypothetical protein